MEKILNLLPRVLLLSFVVKMLLVTPGLADAAIVLFLGASLAVQVLMEKNQDFKQVQDTVNKTISEQTETINKQNEVIKVFAVEHAKLKSLVETVKLKNDFTNTNPLGTRKIG